MDLIEKYNIKEEDLYFLCVIEVMKTTSNFFEKEKLKAKSIGILKPYKVKFMDLGKLLNNIKSKGYDQNQALIEKYGVLNLKNQKSSIGLSYYITFSLVVIFIYFIFKTISVGGKPSECDCQKVIMREEGAMQAGKRIVGDGYYDNTIPAAARQCGLKYWDEIKNWQKSKGLGGTPVDNAMEFFSEKCN